MRMPLVIMSQPEGGCLRRAGAPAHAREAGGVPLPDPLVPVRDVPGFGVTQRRMVSRDQAPMGATPRAPSLPVHTAGMWLYRCGAPQQREQPDGGRFNGIPISPTCPSPRCAGRGSALRCWPCAGAGGGCGAGWRSALPSHLPQLLKAAEQLLIAPGAANEINSARCSELLPSSAPCPAPAAGDRGSSGTGAAQQHWSRLGITSGTPKQPHPPCPVPRLQRNTSLG